MRDLQCAVSLLVGSLGQLFGFGARVGHGFVGLLTGSQHGVEGVHRRAGQTRLHVYPRHFNPQPLSDGAEFGQPLIDALHQITAQAFASFGCLVIGTDQLRTGDQDGVEVPRRGECHSAARHQSIQRRQHMFAL
ncbi:hypothetical protein D3C76_1452400 [compost metagenome]